MDLDSYLAMHRAEWARLEDATRRFGSKQASDAGAEISELVRLYLRASSHLADVQSRYRDPAVEDYLNGLVARAHGVIYSTEARSLRSVLVLLGSRYRTALRNTLPYIALVAVVLAASLVLTDLWVATSPEARAGLLPPQAQAAIEGAGGGTIDPEEAAPALSATILQNNVRVAFLAFALGITLGVGTMFVVVQNGVYIGLLAGGFQAAGKAPDFWALVLPHGFLELIAICIAAGAGLRMGWALVEPGDRPRLTALSDEARDAVLVVVGVVPAFVVAALIEGFVTGRTGLPIVEVGLGAAVAAAYLAFLFLPGRATPGRIAPTVVPAP